MQAEFPPVPVPPRGEWWSDEPPMDNYRHLMQMVALIVTLRWLWRDRTDYFAAGNLTVYYSPTQKKSADFRGPDFFVVKNVDGAKDRKSWVVWEEGGRYPDVIVELLSDTTEASDRGEKKDIYEQIFRTPEYFLFDPYSGEFEGYRLVGGRYRRIEPDAHGLLACDQLELKLGVQDRELRFYFPDGQLVPQPSEEAVRAQQEAARAQQEAVRAQQEAVRAQQESAQAKLDAAGERARREQAEAEVARLRAMLDPSKR